jgi:uncharacterized protein YodC (DUF2158 family)
MVGPHILGRLIFNAGVIMADFAIGDVVRLKSGGPNMTIVKVESLLEDHLLCVWIDSKQKEHRAAYPPKAVQYPEDD